MTPTLDTLSDLYSDAQTCAKLVGLQYVENEAEGLRRVKHGKGFTYRDAQNRAVAESIKRRITELVIPPAWQEVWICPSAAGHVLATGIDEKGRKQYIYHPKWRTMRDLIKFYRMILFAGALPKIRRTTESMIGKTEMSRDNVLAHMLWILDNSYIRIGNETYFQQNESVGLTTLTDKNIVIAGDVVTLSFKGKSGKDQQITFENRLVAKTLSQLCKVKGERLFRYQGPDQHWHSLEANDINAYLHEKTAAQLSAKDFRTWGGTLIAFMHLVDKQQSAQKSEKVIVEAVDQAAAILGNTRTVARSSYVHPHILSTYGSKDFKKYYARAQKHRKIVGLDKHETELRFFLEDLFNTEFNLLKQNQ